MREVNILGVKVSHLSLAEALSYVKNFLDGRERHFITTPNPEIILAAQKDENLRRIINYSDLALPDGFGLKIAAFILREKLRARLPGSDFMLACCALAEAEETGVFLLGGGQGVARGAAASLQKIYPRLKISGSASGGRVYLARAGWTAEEGVTAQINSSGAKILFVAFGCPKQEKWIFSNLDKMPGLRLALTVGGSFDYLAGRKRRAPLLLRRLGLEWAWRLILEPARIMRILQATFVFLSAVIKWQWRIMLKYRHNVVGFIFRGQGEILMVSRAAGRGRTGAWQLPQGGVNDGESEEQAVLREMREEVGTRNLQITGVNSQKYKYDWPRWHQLKDGWRGQEQSIYYLRYTGDGSDLQVDGREHDEYKWVRPEELLDVVQPVRRTMTKIALEGYLKLSS